MCGERGSVVDALILHIIIMINIKIIVVILLVITVTNCVKFYLKDEMIKYYPDAKITMIK